MSSKGWTDLPLTPWFIVRPFRSCVSELVAEANQCVSCYPVPWVHTLATVVYHCGRLVSWPPLQFAVFVHDHDDLGAFDEDPLDSLTVEHFVELLKCEALAVLGLDVLDDLPVLLVKYSHVVSWLFSPNLGDAVLLEDILDLLRFADLRLDLSPEPDVEGVPGLKTECVHDAQADLFRLITRHL